MSLSRSRKCSAVATRVLLPPPSVTVVTHEVRQDYIFMNRPFVGCQDIF